MAKRIMIGLMVLFSTMLLGSLAYAAEPSLHEVYQAANAGKLDEAQKMMHDVLQAHPASGKAHFVEAELLAKQGQLKKAETELATAESLAPGLPFAKPEAVNNLKSRLGSSASVKTPPTQHVQPVQSPQQPSFPWGMIFVGIGLIAFIVWAARFMSQRNSTITNGTGVLAGSGSGTPGANYGLPPQPYPYASGAGQAGAPGQGLGSRVMGGLASGVAVGAGVVAGEALMHHFMGNKEGLSRQGSFDNLSNIQDTNANDDLGGSDFGVNDTSSWDDSSAGDSDWS